MITNRKLSCDFLVAGAGPSGIVAAIQAGRLGLKTVLFEKEMYLGGNAGPNLGIAPTATQVSNPYYNETGIIEELEEKVSATFLRMKPTIVNYNINPQLDSLFAKELRDVGVTILRRHIPLSADVDNGKIVRVELLDIDTLSHLTVEVNGFAMDCSGDAVLAQVCGAETVMGRESIAKTGERSAPTAEDTLISAASLTALVVDTGVDVPFIAPKETPAWNPEKPNSRFDPSQKVHFLWQVDGGGENDENHPYLSQHDLWERLVLRIYSQWNYLKNILYKEELKTHQLIWISPVLGKRETLRIVSKYMLTQTDIETNRIFEDAIGFGGGYLDEHLPSYDGGYEVRYYSRPLPYDIPLRSVCSVNISNLFAGGRCIGVSHLAFTSTRLIRTACMLAQSTAISAWLCEKNGWTTDDLENHLDVLHNELYVHDIFLPGHSQNRMDLTKNVKAVVSSSYARPEDCHVDSFTKAPVICNIYEYPSRPDRVSFYVRTSKETDVTLRLSYGETPAPEYSNPPEVVFNEKTGRFETGKAHGMAEGSADVVSVKGCINYFIRRDVPVEKVLLAEIRKAVPANFDGFVDFDVAMKIDLPQKNRNIWGQCLVAVLSGDVEIGFGVPVVDTCESVVNGMPTSSTAPVFRLSPDCRWGSASNLISGQIARDGHSFTDAWISSPMENLPQSITVELSEEKEISEVILHFDTTERLWKENYIFRNLEASPRLVKSFTIEVLTDGKFEQVFEDTYNVHRYRRISIPRIKTDKVRITVLKTWGSPSARICSLELL